MLFYRNKHIITLHNVPLPTIWKTTLVCTCDYAYESWSTYSFLMEAIFLSLKKSNRDGKYFIMGYIAFKWKIWSQESQQIINKRTILSLLFLLLTILKSSVMDDERGTDDSHSFANLIILTLCFQFLWHELWGPNIWPRI